MKSKLLCEMLDGEGRIGVHPAITGRSGAAHCLHEIFRRVELREHSINWSCLDHSASAFGKIVCISKIEIIGRNRINRNSSAKKSPMVPANVDQSQNVG